MGVCLVLFGVLLTLDRLQILDGQTSLRFWPVVLIGLGAWIVIERRDTGWSLPGIMMVGVGFLLLLNAFGVRVRFWELFWPLIILLVGVRLIVQSPGRRPTSSAAGSGTVNMFSVLGGSQRSSNDKPFRGGEITSILGGTHLDLRQATIEPGGEAVINVFAMMGGHEVWVPSGWTVASEVMPLLGNVEDKRLPALDPTPRSAADTAPRLVLRGIVIMGGITIKN